MQGERGEGRRLWVSLSPALGQAIPDLQPSGVDEGRPALPPSHGCCSEVLEMWYETSLEVLRQRQRGAGVSRASRGGGWQESVGGQAGLQKCQSPCPGRLLWLRWAWLPLPLPAYSSRAFNAAQQLIKAVAKVGTQTERRPRLCRANPSIHPRAPMRPCGGSSGVAAQEAGPSESGLR